MIQVRLIQKGFHYRRPATTSRGTYHSKKVWFIILTDSSRPGISGIGECSLFPGLSHDDVPGFETRLEKVVESINATGYPDASGLHEWPSIRFAIETARLDLMNGGSKLFYPSDFTAGKASIRINGLIWMGPPAEMKAQIREKLEQGYSCLKMKVGAVGIGEELSLLKSVREEYDANVLELRVDANGAFDPETALPVLEHLAKLKIHSIEQPIRQGQAEAMSLLCAESPIPVALDEELIGITEEKEMEALLDTVRPAYIILKPGLLGGISMAEKWARIATAKGIGYWVTSALETNIGLNAIAQWTYTLENEIPQGLSTGTLFSDNIHSPLHIVGERLYYSENRGWALRGFDAAD